MIYRTSYRHSCVLLTTIHLEMACLEVISYGKTNLLKWGFTSYIHFIHVCTHVHISFAEIRALAVVEGRENIKFMTII